MTAQELLERQACGRPGCRCAASLRRGQGLTHCPAHDDRTPSLRVTEEGGRALWRCHAGCSQEAVTAAIAELVPAGQLRPKNGARSRPERREVATYDYRDEQGELLYQVVRYEPKDFRQRRPKAGGGWSWSLNGVRRVLYHQQELAAARPTRRVLLVEGEKDADRLRASGLLATCYAGGVKAPWEPEWSELLRGRRVVILPDADVPGVERALRDAEQLVDQVAELRFVLLPGLEVREDHGQDVSDWLDQGFTLDTLKATVEAASPLTRADVERGLDPRVEAEPQGVPNGEPPAPQLVVRRLAELRSLPGIDLSWLVERFLAAGAVSELTAYIKSGKSTISAQLIASVLHGTPFLDRFPARQGPVVLLTEESPVSLLPELVDAGVEDADDLHLVLWGENSHLSWADAARAAAALCQQVGAALLVVDTLSMWAAVEDENDAGEARSAMAWLLQVASSGLSVLTLRHARKSGGEIHNAGRGSGAYGGAASILLHLDYERSDKGQPDEESSRRILRLKSRLEREQPPAMKLDYQHGLYRLTEPVLSAAEKLASLEERLLTALSNGHGAVSTEELRRMVPSRKGALLQALRVLTDSGQVVRSERESPSQPYRYSSVPEQPELQGTTGTTEPDPGGSSGAGTGARGVVPHKNHPHVREEPRPGEGLDGSLSLGATGNRAPAVTPDPGRCPRCHKLDYEPLAHGRRRCLRCKHVWSPPAG